MGDLEPPEEKVEDFYFKQLKKVRIFNSPDNLPTERANLLAVSNKFGLVFVGLPTGFCVIQTEELTDLDKEHETKSPNFIVSEFECLKVDISHPVRHIAVSCDDLTLSVCYETDDKVVMRLYDVATLCGTGDKKPIGDVRLTTGADLVDLQWNPGIPGMFVTCLSTGVVGIWEIAGSQITQTASLPATTRATAICWSPKGKQLVVGHKNGRLSQYTPVLQLKKEIDCPGIFVSEPHQVTSVYWLSAPVFAAVYTSAEEGDSPKFVVIHNQTKTEPKKIVNFEDVYFGMSEERAQCFFTKYISEWNFAISCSCNAFEIASFSNKNGWVKWTMDDNRAEMPLTDDNEETYPMGMAIGLTSTVNITEHEKLLPPAPILLVLSTDGVLCPFHIVNKKPDAKHDIVKPPEALPQPTQRPQLASVQPAESAPKPSEQVAPKPTVPAASGTPQTGAPTQGLFSLGSGQSAPAFSFNKDFIGGSTFGGSPAVSSTSGLAPASSPFTFTAKPDPAPLPGAATPMLSKLLGASSVQQAATDNTQKMQPQMPVFGTGTQSPSAAKTTPSNTPAPSLFGGPTMAPFTLGPTQKPTSTLVGPGPGPFTAGAQPQVAKGGAATPSLFGASPQSLVKPTGAAPSPFGTIAQSPIKQAPLKVTSAPPAAPSPFASVTQSPLNQPANKLLGGPSSAPSVFTPTPALTQPTQPSVFTPTPATLTQPTQPSVFAPTPASLTQPTPLTQPPQPSVFAPTPASLTQPIQLTQPTPPSAKPLLAASAPATATIPQKNPLQKQVPIQTRQTSSPAPQLVKADQPRPPPPAYTERVTPSPSQADLELSVSKTIIEEIVHFNKELAQLNTNLRDLKKTCHISVQPDTLRDLRKCADDVEKLFKGLKEATKEHSKEIKDSKTTLLGSFEAVDEACIKKDKAQDPRYLHLLKSRSLDPMNADKMRTVRDLYLFLDKTLKEVDMRMDENWYEERQNAKKLQRPAMDTIYRTLKNYHLIAQEQAARLDRIAEQLKARRVLPSSWHRPMRSIASSRCSSLSSLASSAVNQDLDSTNKSPSKVPARVPAKNISALRNMLKKRQTIPVRRQTGGAIASPKVTKPERRHFMSPDATGTPVPFAKTPEDQIKPPKAAMPSAIGRADPPKFSLGQLETPLTRASTKVGQPLSSSTPFVPNQAAMPALIQPGVPGKTGTLPAQTGLLTGKIGVPTKDASAVNAAQATPRGFSSLQARDGAAPGNDAGPFQGTNTRGSFLPPRQEGSAQEQAVPDKSFGFVTAPDRPASFQGVPTKPPTALDSKVAIKPAPRPLPDELPAGKAAALAAIGRATAIQPPPQPPSNLDPGASVEPVTMVTHKSDAPGLVVKENAKDSDTRALAIANEAVKAAHVEAQKPTANPPPKPSTEFTFKTSDTPKPGPPVVTFKPATAQDKGPYPNVTVKPVALQPSVNRLPFGAPGTLPVAPFAPKPKGETATKAPDAGFTFPSSGLQFAPPSDAPKSGFSFSLPSKSTSGAFGSPVGATNSPFTLPAKDHSVSSVSADSTSTGNVSGFGSVHKAEAVESDDAKTDIKPSAVVSRRLFEGEKREEPSALQQSAPEESKLDSPQASASAPADTDLSSLSGTSSSSSVLGKPKPVASTGAPGAQDGTIGTTGFVFSATSSGFSFGAPTADKPPTSTTSGFTFGAPAPSGSPITKPVTTTPDTTAPTETASDASTTTPSTAGLIGVTPASTTSTPDLFGNTTGGLFASSGTTGLFKPSTSTSSTAPGSSPSSSMSLFGKPAVAADSPAKTSSDGAGLLSQPTTTASTVPQGGSPFAQAATSTAAPVVQATTATSAGSTTGSLFGTATTTSPFANAAALGGSPNAVGLFGAGSTTPSSTGSLFGAPSTTQQSSGGLFGSTTQTSSTSLFGGSATTTQPSSGGLFGSAPTFGAQSLASTTSAGLFGSTTTSASSPFGFGQTTTASAAPVFGQTTTTSATPVFGQASSATPLFGQTSSSSAAPVFGQTSTTPSSSVFGQTPTSTSVAGFGQPTSTASAFGQSAFSKPQEASSGGLSFGLGGFGLGGSPSQNANKNPFGISDASAQPSTGTSLFGGKSVSSPPSFGSQPSFGSSPSSFGGGSFSRGGGNVGASGFAVSATGTGQSPGLGSGFGTTPAFGSASGFGSGNAFGSAPAFGSQPAFGSFPQTGQTSGSFGSSPGGSFGQSSSLPTFGSVAQSGGSPGFGAMAQSSSPGFGDVAQQSPTGFGAFGGAAQQPSFGSFGGSGGGSAFGGGGTP